MKLKSKCCKKYRKKSEACRKCPLMARLDPEQKKRLLRKARKRAQAG